MTYELATRPCPLYCPLFFGLLESEESRRQALPIGEDGREVLCEVADLARQDLGEQAHLLRRRTRGDRWDGGTGSSIELGSAPPILARTYDRNCLDRLHIKEIAIDAE